MSIIPSPAGSSPALARPPVDPVRAVEVFLDAHAELPVARPPVSTPGGVVVTVGDVDGLADWLAACGGTIRRSIPDDGVQTWQLYTSLPPRADGSRVAVRVVTAAAEDVPVADEVLSAVVSSSIPAARGPMTADQLAERDAKVRAKVLREGAAEVRARCLSVPGRCGCHTAAALLDAMARADGTGLLHCETPARRGDTITEHGHQMTCAPPALAWARRLDAHGLAAFLLDLASAAGGYWQRDDHAEVLARVEGVLAQHRDARAGDGPDACGHDADDRCEGCGRCPCAVCATDRVCRCECTCPPSVPDGGGDSRG